VALFLTTAVTICDRPTTLDGSPRRAAGLKTGQSRIVFCILSSTANFSFSFIEPLQYNTQTLFQKI